MRMPVSCRSQLGNGIVQVKGHQVLPADHPIEAFPRGLVSVPVSELVAGGKNVAGVETDSCGNIAILQGAEQVPKLLETAAQVRAAPR